MYDLVGNRTARSDLSLGWPRNVERNRSPFAFMPKLGGRRGYQPVELSIKSGKKKSEWLTYFCTLKVESHLLGLVCLWEVLLDSYGQSISQICSIS